MDGRQILRARWVGAVLAMVLLLSGCGALSDSVTGRRWELPNDGPSPPVSRAAALSLLRKALTAGQGAIDTQTLSLTVTDAEVSSFLNIRRELSRELGGMTGVGLDQLGQLEGMEGLEVEGADIDTLRRLLGQGDSGDGLRMPRLRIGLREAAVHFKGDGRLIARGDIGFLRWGLPVRMVLAPTASDGELALNFVEGQIGPVALPAFVFNLLDRGLAELLLLGQAYAQVQEVAVTEGAFTIRGQYRLD